MKRHGRGSCRHSAAPVAAFNPRCAAAASGSVAPAPAGSARPRVSSPPSLRAAGLRHLQLQGGVVQIDQAGQQVTALEDDAHALAPQVGQAGAAHVPRTGPLQPRQQEQQRGLARVRRPGNSQARTRRDTQVHVAQHLHLAGADGVLHGQAIGLDQVGVGMGHGRCEGLSGAKSGVCIPERFLFESGGDPGHVAAV